MVPPRVADVFRIHQRFTRSVNLERDFEDHSSLQGYVVTPHAKTVLDRLVSGLAPESSQRAWRITGDYGTGKSSLALALAHLLSAEGKDVPARLRQAVDFRELGVSRPHLLPVLVTGSRDSLTLALLRGLERAVERVRTRGKTEVLVEASQAAFLFLTRHGEQCIVEEGIAHNLKVACARAADLYQKRIDFLIQKGAEATTTDKLRPVLKELKAFAENAETLFRLRGPFPVPPGQELIQLEKTPLAVARGLTLPRSYRQELPLLLNIVPGELTTTNEPTVEAR